MLIRKIVAIVGLALAVALSAENYDTTTDDNDALALDIDKAVKYGLINNLIQKNNAVELQTKLLNLATSWNYIVDAPSASISINKGLTHTVSDNANNSASTEGIDIGINTGLSISASSIFKIIQIANDYNKGKLNYEQLKLKFNIEIKRSYYSLVVMEKQLELKELALANAKILFDAASLKFDNGVISEIDRLKSEYAYKTLIPELNKLKNSYKNSLNSFKQIIGIDIAQKIELSSDIPEFNADIADLVKDFEIDNNRQVQTLVYDLNSAEYSRNNYIANIAPTFNLGYAFSGSNDFKNAGWNVTNSLKLSVSMGLDGLLPFSSAQTNIINSQYNINKIKNNILNQKQLISLELNKTADTLNELKNSMKSYEMNIEIADKTYEMSEKLYSSGRYGYLEFKQAEENKFDARLKLLNSKYEFLSNVYDLEYLIGKEIIR
ncbi:MAG: TolC family protein [Spirochaetes bacterium]|nr:TolC family protein [Spirochaetota bacterium]